MIRPLLWMARKRLLKSLARLSPGFRLRAAFLRAAGYRIGRDVYIGEDLIVIDELEEKGLLSIGDRAAVAERVTLVIASRPNFSRIAPFVTTGHGPITIEEDAWLGTGSIIMPDIKVGRGAVVGAGALVTKDVPPFTIVAGIPAKPMRTFEVPM